MQGMTIIKTSDGKHEILQFLTPINVKITIVLRLIVD